MSNEAKREASYKRLRIKKKRMDEAHVAYSKARSEYHKELETYIELDRAVALQNATVLPPVEEP